MSRSYPERTYTPPRIGRTLAIMAAVTVFGIAVIWCGDHRNTAAANVMIALLAAAGLVLFVYLLLVPVVDRQSQRGHR